MRELANKGLVVKGTMAGGSIRYAIRDGYKEKIADALGRSNNALGRSNNKKGRHYVACHRKMRMRACDRSLR